MKLNTGKIRKEMKRLGWNQSKMAQEMGISRQAVCYYLKSRPTVMKTERIARALGLDPKDLLL